MSQPLNLQSLPKALQFVANGRLLQGTDEVVTAGGNTDACARIPNDGIVLFFSQNAMSFSRGDKGGADGMGEVL